VLLTRGPWWGRAHGSREVSVFQRRGRLSIEGRFHYTETVIHRELWAMRGERSDAPAEQNGAGEIPEELALEIRKLAHDLSNALEIIVQTSYLLGTVELKEPGGDWLRLLDSGVRKALDINQTLREYVKGRSPR